MSPHARGCAGGGASDRTSPRHEAAHWLTLLRGQYPELLEELTPGGRSPGAGRTTPGPATPVRTTAPLRLHVSDALRDISDGVTELEEAVREKLGLARARRVPVPQRLGRLLAQLDDVAAHPVLAAHVRSEARRLARRCARALGDSEPMTAVEGRCPHCGSVSLRAFPERGAVMCINPACRCGDPACDCWTDPAHRHVWPETEPAGWERAEGVG
ncbi:hypothetical protein LHJ74_22885 [Streptomyces sp. N2-109]|uniref:Uncharacterized protein n=1 Tax=Streptomyces gossypii TaxID=2883101 RepID=A0ABT2JXU6_9ACTN|nr:hypothetical protein [Streptomyces gossypii]MCT2592723.1 hypothetical protein [Streptomyces gossypii]